LRELFYRKANKKPLEVQVSYLEKAQKDLQTYSEATITLARLKDKAVAALPKDFPEFSISDNSAYCQLGLRLEVETLEQAIAICESVGPDRMYYVRNGWASFMPEHEVKARSYPVTDEFDKHKMRYTSAFKSLPYYVETSKYERGTNEVVFHFYTTLNGITACVDIKLTKEPRIYIYQDGPVYRPVCSAPQLPKSIHMSKTWEERQNTRWTTSQRFKHWGV
jgi:hypothetical protein